MAQISKRKEELRKEIDKVLRQMCFARSYREYCEGVITLMEIVFRDYEYED